MAIPRSPDGPNCDRRASLIIALSKNERPEAERHVTPDTRTRATSVTPQAVARQLHTHRQ
jgi:hypothetical protein